MLSTDTMYKMIASHIVQYKAAVEVAPDAAAATNAVADSDAMGSARLVPRSSPRQNHLPWVLALVPQSSPRLIPRYGGP